VAGTNGPKLPGYAHDTWIIEAVAKKTYDHTQLERWQLQWKMPPQRTRTQETTDTDIRVDEVEAQLQIQNDRTGGFQIALRECSFR